MHCFNYYAHTIFSLPLVWFATIKETYYFIIFLNIKVHQLTSVYQNFMLPKFYFFLWQSL